MTATPQPQPTTPQPRPSTPWDNPGPVRPSGPRILPTDAQVAHAGRRLDQHPDPDRSTTVALGEIEGAAWVLALYLDGRPDLAAEHPDLVTGVQRMLAVGRAWDDRYGLAAQVNRKAADTALGDQVEAWLRAAPPVIPGDEPGGEWWR
jgi:hypothetical protein